MSVEEIEKKREENKANAKIVFTENVDAVVMTNTGVKTHIKPRNKDNPTP